jgi:hypothetical protein
MGTTGPGFKALETAGIVRLEGRYFLLGGKPLGYDIIVTSDNIHGPYVPTPRNHRLIRTPQIFHRVYDLPGGYLSMPMVWVNRERKYYHVAPFRRVEAEGKSIWFKWWEGNEKLKVHKLPASLETLGGTGNNLRMLREVFDLSRGLVLEASLKQGREPETNLALSSSGTACNVYSRDWFPEGYFAPANAVDGRETTCWGGLRAEDPDSMRFDLDLGRNLPVGRIRAKFMGQPPQVSLKYSTDGSEWTASGSDPESLPHEVRLWEHLDISARYLRHDFVLGPAGTAGFFEKLNKNTIRMSELEVYSEPVERIGKEACGLVLETLPGEGYGWLVERSGRVRFGLVSEDYSLFQCLRTRDLEVDLGRRAEFRIVMRDDLVDLYVNDYQVDYYYLDQERPNGRIGLYSAGKSSGKPDVKAWRPDPAAKSRK